MLRSYLITAIRDILRHKGYSAISILGIAVGMAGATLVLMYISQETGYDRCYPDGDRIYRVITDDSRWRTTSAETTCQLAAAVRRHVTGVEQVTSFRAVPLRVNTPNGQEFDFCYSADPDFLELFSLLTPSDKAAELLPATGSLVMTESMAKKYFGSEVALGKTLGVEVEGERFELTVTGIIPEFRHKTTLIPRMIVSADVGERYLNRLFTGAGISPHEDWFSDLSVTYVRLVPGTRPEQIEASLASMLKNVSPPNLAKTLKLQPLSDIYFHSSHLINNPTRQGNLPFLYIFSAVAILILVMALANHIVLTAARLAAKYREIGIRRAVGAGDFHVVDQLAVESALVALMALPIALVLVEIGLPRINGWFGIRLGWETNYGAVIAGLALTVVTVTVISTIAAYLRVTRAKTAKILGVRNFPAGERLLLRRGVVLIQLTTLAGLFSSVGVVIKQVHHATSQNLGYERQALMSLQLWNYDGPSVYPSLKTRLSQCPGVAAVSGASLLPPYDGYGMIRIPNALDPTVSVNVESMLVDYGLVEALGLEIVEGRTFSEESDNPLSGKILLNESAVRALGLEQPLAAEVNGQTVIGVLKDFHFHSFRKRIEPLVVSLSPAHVAGVVVRLGAAGDTAAIAAVNRVWKETEPDAADEFIAVDDILYALYAEERAFGELVAFFSLLAALIACMGLFGLSAFVVQQRTKELGIRKVLGASSTGLTYLLTREYLLLAVIANLLAAPLVYYAMGMWLDNFSYRVSIGAELLAATAILTTVLAMLSVSLNSVAAARANPVEALRYE